jgi:hypothetical protein
MVIKHNLELVKFPDFRDPVLVDSFQEVPFRDQVCIKFLMGIFQVHLVHQDLLFMDRYRAALYLGQVVHIAKFLELRYQEDTV